MPRPETAPPSVIVFSWGTTSGISPCRSVASTRSSYVVIPPTIAVRATGSMLSTLLKADTSSVTNSDTFASRNRKRFDVDLASLTWVPAGIAAY